MPHTDAPHLAAADAIAYRRLAGAVLANACREAAVGNLDALVFLVLDGPIWMEELGFDGQAVRAWLAGDMRVPRGRGWA
jgi:hypothetical protein